MESFWVVSATVQGEVDYLAIFASEAKARQHLETMPTEKREERWRRVWSVFEAKVGEDLVLKT